MKIVRYMKAADRVLREFTRIFGKAIRAIREGELSVQSYRNGREDGYTLTLWRHVGMATASRSVTFSENRNSDEIVLYPGDMSFSEAETEKAYAGRVYVKPENYERAAHVVARMLKVKIR